jgi:GT2 family glycosyltransferase
MGNHIRKSPIGNQKATGGSSLTETSYETEAAEERVNHSLVTLPLAESVRPEVKGKFLVIGDQKFYVRGVTYGPFNADHNGDEFHDDVVDRDFKKIAANGMNVVRTYTVPPRWLLDTAQRHGLRVMVGLPWEQHIAFLDDRKRRRSIQKGVLKGVQACAGHPAVLCYTIGNEIPASIVRWYGHHRVESFLKQLYLAVKAEDPGGLVTYVNFPTTEYLQLPFLDFFCFNVYLESQQAWASYLARLQNIAGERPLVMAEIGLDSYRNGEDQQAEILDWQIREAFAHGCAGVFVFSWTDEWHRGGFDITDWGFGLTDRNRRPKPALSSVRDAFVEVPFTPNLSWPYVSVVVCTYNGSRTIRKCCEGLRQLQYPNYEIIVVNDGSTDSTAKIAAEYGYRLISTENMGLSNARNLGMKAAKGEIVAYLDDDARPDPYWLQYLAATFSDTKHVGVGGPNIAPQGDGVIAEGISNSPGNPTHILLSDQEAEHIPGCNMAFRKEALRAINGFDPQFRIAGDDVDICWRLQQRGWTLGFSPAAMVWHHCRNSVKSYWKQQVNYGKAEALLEIKWPEKYNGVGQSNWEGRIYGNGSSHIFLFHNWRIYYGVWGSGLFQSIYEPAAGAYMLVPMIPEWYMGITALGVLSALSVFWSPLLLALPLFVLAFGTSLIQASLNAGNAMFPRRQGFSIGRLKLHTLTTFLHILQPLARLWGRLHYGRRPPRQRGTFVLPRPRTSTIWSEHWQPAEERLRNLEAMLREHGAVVKRGGDFDRWDLEVRGGIFGTIRILMGIEEHGAGRQLARFRSWPRVSSFGLGLTLLFACLSTVAAIDQAWLASANLGLIGMLMAIRVFGDCAAATVSFLQVLNHRQVGEE